MNTVKQIILWTLAFVFTIAMAKYQRTTGPTYPVDGSVLIAGTEIDFELLRTHGGESDHPVKISGIKGIVESGEVLWKRYKLDEPTHALRMDWEGDDLVAYLPNQPPAGKLEYQVVLHTGSEKTIIPADEPVVIRFKGDVPAWALLPHILLMFAALLVSARVAFGAILGMKTRTLVWVTLAFTVVGGLIFGPIVQKFAFGAFWTGWPFGEDLTDNKTAVFAIAWLAALWMLRGNNGEKRGRWWVVGAAVVMFIVYLIPHSMRGSELDYSALPPDSLKVVTRIEAPDSAGIDKGISN